MSPGYHDVTILPDKVRGLAQAAARGRSRPSKEGDRAYNFHGLVFGLSEYTAMDRNSLSEKESMSVTCLGAVAKMNAHRVINEHMGRIFTSATYPHDMSWVEPT